MDVDQKLSKDFTLREFLRSEYAARHGLTIIPSREEVVNLTRLCQDVLQPVRNLYGRMRITSGLRPAWLNQAIGGSKTSSHMYGCAADVEFVTHEDEMQWVFDDLRTQATKGTLFDMPFDQIILEFPPDGWIHFGVARVGAEARRQFLIARKLEGKTVYERVY